MTAWALLAMAVPALALGSASAADLVEGYYAQPYCTAHEATALLAEDNIAALKTEVARLMDEGIAASHDQRWLYSARPVFVWANETKYACGKAYGYLKTNYRDEQNLNKCGCAHSRMVSFMH